MKPVVRTARRLLVALAAYASSVIGIIFVPAIHAPNLMSPESAVPMTVWAVAWLLHLVLCIAWIANKQLHGAWSAIAVLAGSGMLLASGIAFPVLVLFGAPVFLLGVWIVYFQARSLRKALPSLSAP